MTPDVALAEGLAVVSGHHDQGVGPEPARREGTQDEARRAVGVVHGVPAAVEEQCAHLLGRALVDRGVGDLVGEGLERRAILREPVALVRCIEQQEGEEGCRGLALVQPLLEAAHDAVVAAARAREGQASVEMCRACRRRGS